MSPETLQLVTVLGGLAGTLLAVWMTHALLLRAETRRLAAEDQRRWHGERHRALRELSASAIKAIRSLLDGAAYLPPEGGGQEAIGAPDIGLTPEEGVDGFFDADERVQMLQLAEKMPERLDQVERDVSSLALVVSGEVLVTAEELSSALWDCYGMYMEYRNVTEFSNRLGEAQDLFNQLSDQARAMLGAEGSLDSARRW